MKFDKVQFVYIDIDYLEYLSKNDSEIFYNKENNKYNLKPHLGVLLNNDGMEYVIPLTSAKEKHKKWKDVSASWYRIYEIIDITEDYVDENDIVVEIKNQDIIKKIAPEDVANARQRILSILDIRKMFPVDKSVYQEVKFDICNNNSVSDTQRTFLMIKEYLFLKDISEDIANKATKIYQKQINKDKVLPYHCNYRKLEEAFLKYKKEKK